jgi:hypothetical protein
MYCFAYIKSTGSTSKSFLMIWLIIICLSLSLSLDCHMFFCPCLITRVRLFPWFMFYISCKIGLAISLKIFCTLWWCLFLKSWIEIEGLNILEFNGHTIIHHQCKIIFTLIFNKKNHYFLCHIICYKIIMQ